MATKANGQSLNEEGVLVRFVVLFAFVERVCIVLVAVAHSSNSNARQLHLAFPPVAAFLCLFLLCFHRALEKGAQSHTWKCKFPL